ncbi:MAG: rhomboid family intramembrane serine protease [Vicinamibacterales bacterium]|nr:rhomboid family intramembrane serine protease [Vicinamibacterales bacterium]
MSRFPSGATMSFGPGALTPVIKMLVITNVVMFVLSKMAPVITLQLGLVPAAVFGSLAIWQPVTYLFLHGDVMHILFNMLALWMFGTEFERMWGSRFFAKYYFVTGIGAGVVTLGVSLWSDSIYYAVTIGASGAIYGILLAYGMYFPNRPIYLYFIFPIPAKYFVMLIGGIAFLSSMGSSGGPVAHWAHLGGFVVGYVYLKSLRTRPFDEIKYRWLKWKMQRARSKFDVHRGGRSDDDWKSDWKKHIH